MTIVYSFLHSTVEVVVSCFSCLKEVFFWSSLSICPLNAILSEMMYLSWQTQYQFPVKKNSRKSRMTWVPCKEREDDIKNSPSHSILTVSVSSQLTSFRKKMRGIRQQPLHLFASQEEQHQNQSINHILIKWIFRSFNLRRLKLCLERQKTDLFSRE
jgi:hypothetical protein